VVSAGRSEGKTSQLAGSALIVTCIGFMVVFQVLATKLGYPEILDRPAHEVLPRLLQGGGSLRATWMLYAALPSGLAIAALASFPVLQRSSPIAGLGALISGVLGAVAMTVGLLRWSTLHWTLAEAYQSADAGQREILSSAFDASNLYLGNAIGELCGELLMACFFFLSGFALRGAAGVSRWWSVGSMLSAVLFAVGSLRVLSDVVQPLADFNNLWLGVWLLVHGASLVRLGARG
jgi:hypothetical protein